VPAITRRSKLEIRIDILRVLAHNGPLKTTQIMNKTNANSGAKKPLDSLVQRKLVKKKTSKRKGRKSTVSYAITARGQAVVKHFEEVGKALQTQAGTKE
jgi:predicted transcriptional regulator